MEEATSTLPERECAVHRRKRVEHSRPVFVDDECSTDSGCSSRGSSESNERLSRRESVEHVCGSASSSASGQCSVHRLRGNHPSSTRSQERLTSSSSSSGSQQGHHHRSCRSKSSRSWSPSGDRGHDRHHHHHSHHRHNSRDSPSHSSSPSDAQSSDSDSFKRPSKAEVIRRALKCLKISKFHDNCPTSNANSGKEKNKTKKSPRRILREPVSYTYVKGLSGLPTQRVPRSAVPQVMKPCSCYETIGLYR